ncbi:MAG TPA: PorV/PorQ family protein, partial [bacterium]|nr:PorV/PorQ family protein [bacterium]
NLGFYLPRRSVTGTHMRLVPDLADDVYLEYASYAGNIEDWGNWGLNIMYLTYGESEATDGAGNSVGTFTSWDMGIGAGWGTAVTERFAVGAGAKLVMSRLAPEIGGLEEGRGTTWAVDLGVHGRDLAPMNLRWGLQISNLGPALKFVDNGAPNSLPLNVRTGFGFDPYVDETHRFTVALDMNKTLVRQRGGDDTGEKFSTDPGYKALFTAWTDDSIGEEFEDAIYNFGMEYGFSDFIFLRTGYIHDKLGDITDYAYGIGVAYQSYRFDYASYPQASTLDNVNRFSITAEF